MPTTIDLGDLTPIVDSLVENGRYVSRDAVLREAVRLVEQQEAARDALLAELQIGVDDLDAGRFYTSDEVTAELAARRLSRSAPKAA